MNSVYTRSECIIGTRIDEQPSSEFSVLSFRFFRRFANDAHSFAGKRLEFADGQVFLSKLDVVDAAASRFLDFLQQTRTARSFVARKPGAAGDVVQEWASSHQHSANRSAEKRQVRPRRSRPGLGNLGQNFLFFFLGRAAEVVF